MAANTEGFIVGRVQKKSPRVREFSFADFFPRRVYLAANAVRELVNLTYESQFGLTDPQFRIIGRLKHFGRCTQQEISDATTMEKMAVSRAARGLVERGYVHRQAHSEDGRAHLLSLTEEGLALSVRIEARAVELETALLASWTPEERLRFRNDLERLTDHARLHLQRVAPANPAPRIRRAP